MVQYILEQCVFLYDSYMKYESAEKSSQPTNNSQLGE
jgi:hypothetical protein